ARRSTRTTGAPGGMTRPRSSCRAPPQAIERWRSRSNRTRSSSRQARRRSFDAVRSPTTCSSARRVPRSIARGTSQRPSRLAHAWAAAEARPAGKARAIAQPLAREYPYDLRSPSWGAEQPLDHFLFESRRGHCEFFATALALLVREVGVPSRVATGFLGGSY